MVYQTKRSTWVIFGILWLGALISYGLAAVEGYDLLFSDKLGLVGLVTITIIGRVKPILFSRSLFILLSLGSLNIVSFVYYINLVFSFGFAGAVSPGIQVYSTLLLFALIQSHRGLFRAMTKFAFTSETNDLQSRKNQQFFAFYNRFEHLSCEKLRQKLDEDLVPEARQAVEKLLDEHKTGER